MPGASEACTSADAAVDPNDVDGDSVMNADDNCPADSNPMQENEDGDEFGDVCDPCPPFNGAADNVDGDGDGVGDSCDPDQTVPGNRIELFAGFSVPSAIDPTAIPMAQWSFAGGEAQLASTANQRSLLVWPMPTNRGSETVLVRMVPTAIDSTLPIGIGLTTKYDVVANQGIVCWLAQNVGEASASLRLQHYGGTTLNTATPLALTVNTTYRPDITRRTTTFTCHEPTTAQRPNGNSAYAPTAPYAGIITVGVSARIQWLLIVSGP